MAIIKNPIIIMNSSAPSGSVEFVGGIDDIPAHSFYENQTIKSIVLPDTTESIGGYAFWNCYNLKSVVLPAKMDYIDDYAFQDCQSLTSVTILATTPPYIGKGVFSYVSEDLVIYVPSSALSDYLEAWSEYANIIQAIPE